MKIERKPSVWRGIYPNTRAFNDGFWSFHNGVQVNPYPSHRFDESREWQRGWDSAYSANKG